MPNIETLIDSISQIINDYKTKSADYFLFSTIDPKYAYIRLNLHHDPAKHCNFNIISVDMTGTYRFKTCFYGLTDTPAKFQKAIGYTLIGLENTFCFLDDILIVIKCSEKDQASNKLPHKLYADNLQRNLPKCQLAKQECSWLAYNITQSGISPFPSKISAILSLQLTNTHRNL